MDVMSDILVAAQILIGLNKPMIGMKNALFFIAFCVTEVGTFLRHKLDCVRFNA